MSDFGLQLNNPTSNTVEVQLFQLGNVGSSRIYNGVTATSDVVSIAGVTTVSPIQFVNLFEYGGDLTEINDNVNQFVTVDSSEVKINASTSFPFNPLGGRFITYSDASTDTVLQGLTALVPLTDWSDEVVNVFETKVGETDVISVTPISQIRWDGVAYTLEVNFEINYLVSDSYISSTPTFLPIQNFTILNTANSFISNAPTSSASSSWQSNYTTINGIVISGTTGDDYGSIEREQIGRTKVINNIRVTPLQSTNFNESKRIEQCLESMKFTRVDSDGKSNTLVLNPTVDLYQSLVTLDYLNIGDRTDEFPLDGQTRFSYQLLPFASVRFDFDYTELPTFVLADEELVKEIVELNRVRNKVAREKSKFGKEFTLKIDYGRK